jgi:hypothetical protein
MRRYKNYNGNSGIFSFHLLENGIEIVFSTDKKRKYIYNQNRPGLSHVKMMHMLAINGRGLAAYINKNVRDNYDSIEEIV